MDPVVEAIYDRFTGIPNEGPMQGNQKIYFGAD